MNINEAPKATINRNVARVQFETENFRILIDFTLWGYDRESQRKARVSVDGEDEVDFTEAYALQKANGYQNRGVNPEEDKLFAKLNRQVVANKKAVIEAAKAESAYLAEMLDGRKLAFSRTAGCSCGCSPAFVPDRHLGGTIEYPEHDGTTRVAEGVKVRNLWVTRKTA